MDIGGGVNFPYNLDNFEISDEENETYDIDMAVSSNKQNASIKQNKNVDDSGNLQEVSVAMVESHIMEDRPKKKKARTEPQKIADNALKHTVLVPCFNCKQTCLEKITEERRKIFHDSYWALSREQQSSWLISTVTTHPPTRRRANTKCLRTCSFSKEYLLSDDNGIKQKVCMKFFLSTLGYTHDSMLRKTFKSV